MTVYLNIGTNLGDRKANISRAVKEIEAKIGDVLTQSSIVESEPWGFVSDNSFYNIGLAVSTEYKPNELLDVIHSIEKDCGSASHRNADGTYADRVVDIDIMDIDGLTIDTERLTVPHKHLMDRVFFKEPYLELKQKLKNK